MENRPVFNSTAAHRVFTNGNVFVFMPKKFNQFSQTDDENELNMTYFLSYYYLVNIDE